jgi:hypothetical protein
MTAQGRIANMFRGKSIVALWVALLSGVTAYGTPLLQDQTKSIKARYYTSNRPVDRARPSPSKNQTGTIRVMVKKKSRPPGTGSKKPVPTTQAETARLGFTVWRVREDSNSEGAKGVRVVPERRETDAPYSIGEKIQMGVESLSHSGYLYVIEREKYSDGTYGVPMLVYPLLEGAGGDNRVKPGDLTIIPGKGEAFELIVNTDRKQVAEEFIIILSPKPLIDASILKKDPIELSATQTLNWLKDWSTDATQIDSVETVGQALTQEEERAAAGDQKKGVRVRPLSPDDPMPQTVIETKVKRGDPMITTVTLAIRQG